MRISVIDQGCGLKQVDTHKLFTRFYQGTGEQSGTGVGLSYSKILVELHGGSIGAQDNEETGATILVSSHNLNHTVDICPRIALLENGKIIRDIDNKGNSAEKELEDYFNVTE